MKLKIKIKHILVFVCLFYGRQIFAMSSNLKLDTRQLARDFVQNQYTALKQNVSQKVQSTKETIKNEAINFSVQHPQLSTALHDAALTTAAGSVWLAAEKYGYAPAMFPTIRDTLVKAIVNYPKLTPFGLALMGAGQTYRIWSQGQLEVRAMGVKNAIKQCVFDLLKAKLLLNLGAKIVPWHWMSPLTGDVVALGTVGGVVAGIIARTQKALQVIPGQQFAATDFVDKFVQIPGSNAHMLLDFDGTVRPISKTQTIESCIKEGTIFAEWYQHNQWRDTKISYTPFEEFVWQKVYRSCASDVNCRKLISLSSDNKQLAIVTQDSNRNCFLRRFELNEENKNYVWQKSSAIKIDFSTIVSVQTINNTIIVQTKGTDPKLIFYNNNNLSVTHEVTLISQGDLAIFPHPQHERCLVVLPNNTLAMYNSATEGKQINTSGYTCYPNTIIALETGYIFSTTDNKVVWCDLDLQNPLELYTTKGYVKSAIIQNGYYCTLEISNNVTQVMYYFIG